MKHKDKTIDQHAAWSGAGPNELAAARGQRDAVVKHMKSNDIGRLSSKMIPDAMVFMENTSRDRDSRHGKWVGVEKWRKRNLGKQPTEAIFKLPEGCMVYGYRFSAALCNPWPLHSHAIGMA